MSGGVSRAAMRDTGQRAQRILDIATGDVDDEPRNVEEVARKHGEARAKKVSPERSEIARKAAITTWENEGGR